MMDTGKIQKQEEALCSGIEKICVNITNTLEQMKPKHPAQVERKEISAAVYSVWLMQSTRKV